MVSYIRRDTFQAFDGNSSNQKYTKRNRPISESRNKKSGLRLGLLYQFTTFQVIEEF